MTDVSECCVRHIDTESERLSCSDFPKIIGEVPMKDTQKKKGGKNYVENQK